MKRSEINAIYRRAQQSFANNGWALPPFPKWDITDFCLNRFYEVGLVLITLSDEEEYCEKLMFALERQTTPIHKHKVKKEDIICRSGKLQLQLWNAFEGKGISDVLAKKDGQNRFFKEGEPIVLEAGERITLYPGVYHSFRPISEECIIGEVSTGNNDLEDNFFIDNRIGRFPDIEEDETAAVKLLWEQEDN